MRKTLLDRFEEKYIPEPMSGCWLWLAEISPQGYGRIYDGQDYTTAHRVSHRLFKGPIPHGFDVDHLCRNRCCVNPDHLEAVTRQENARRGMTGHHMKGKTHCKHGHKLDGANTHFRPNGNRTCRTCATLKTQRQRAKKRQFYCDAA